MAYDERRDVARDDSVAGSLGRIPAGRKRMPLSERAKIFQPFNPLKGFAEALRQKEREAELAALLMQYASFAASYADERDTEE